MFKRSKVKIAAFVLGILLIFWAGTIALIYMAAYREVNSENREMLETYAELYAAYGNPQSEEDTEGRTGIPDMPDGTEERPGDGENVPDFIEDLENDPDLSVAGERRYQTSTFYSVAFSEDGEAAEINNEETSQMSDEELTHFAEEILQTGKTSGKEGNVLYLVTEEEEFTLVTMMDNTVLAESIQTLLQYTLLFGAAAVIVLFFIAIVFANQIIRPLEKSYRKQKQFISDAGHELKTPVSTIAANAELLEREIAENPWLSNIRYENERMSEIVQQLLELARLESVSMARTQVDFSRIVLAGLLPFEAGAFEQGLRLEYDVDENIYVNGNEGKLAELVSVLTDNALKHCKEQGTVTVSLRQEHKTIQFSVANEGEEIPEEKRDKIFDRFYRVDESREQKNGSYGLGLAIAKAIVTAHQGKISVSCDNGVTTFNVILQGK